MKPRFLLSTIVAFLFIHSPIFPQIDFNFGISPGMTISNLNKDRGSTDDFEDFLWREQTIYQNVLGHSNSVFATLGYKNLSLRINGIYQRIGAKIEVKTELEIPEGYHLNAVKETLHADILMFPIQLEIRLPIKKMKPYIVVGISPSWIHNLRQHRETLIRVDTLGISSLSQFAVETSLKDYLDSPTYASEIIRTDIPYTIGLGFYLNPRIALEATYFKGRKEFLCEASNQYLTGTCFRTYKNRYFRLSINLHFKKQNFSTIWEKKRRGR